MTAALEVVVRLGETIVDVQYVTDRYELAGEALALEPGITRRGLMDITMTRVERPTRSVPLTPHGDRRAVVYIAVSLAAHLVVWGVTPAPSEEVVERKPPPRLARLVPTPRPVTPRWERGPSPAFAMNGGGSAKTGDAGAAGGHSPSSTGRMQIAKRHDVPQISRATAIAKAGQAGIAGALDAHGFEALVGTADLSSGFDRSDTHAPLYGGSGAGHGTFGLAREGTGTGGRCFGAGCGGGIIGTGPYGTISNGTGSGYGWGGGRGGMRGRETAMPMVIPCAGIKRPCYVAKGGLDKSIVRRYVKRALPKIQFCYEKELLASPQLAGEVTTSFLIGLDGKVQESNASGVSVAVASCVNEVIRAIEFPRAQDGATEVHYPFTFRSSGS
jgi:hypothetical protein